MDSRRNIPPAYDEHSRMMRRGPLPPTQHPMELEPLPSPELLENKMASQAAEIERLTMDNRKLAASYLGLRQDLSSAKGESEKIREHIRSIQNEGDIQIRILLDKIAKTDADIGAGDTIKKELQTAHSEARNLMTDKLQLSVKLEQATKELDYSREDIKKIPEMRSQLDSLRQEYQMLRKTFEYEKGTNVEKVEQMKILEKDLVGIAEEVERLRAEALIAEKRAIGSIPYMNPENRYPVPYHGSGGYSNGGAVAVEMMNPYANASGGWGGDHSCTSQAVEGEVMSGAAGAGAGVGAEVHDTSSAQR